jgi:hypothetical protein
MSDDDGESQGGFFAIGGGLSGLLGIAALIAAVNNPSDADLRAWVRSQFEQGAAADGNMFAGLLAQSVSAEYADAFAISSTNYIVLTHFEVATPDLRLMGGPAPEQGCLIGVMNNFYPCGEVSDAVSGGGSQPSRNDDALPYSDAADVEIADPSLSLDRSRGWVCDGARVRFSNIDHQADPFRPPVTVDIVGQQSIWSISYSTGTGSAASIGESNDPRFGDAWFGYSEATGILSFNERDCAPVQ